jgi:3-methyladenine DNA glycosylase AlkD
MIQEVLLPGSRFSTGFWLLASEFLHKPLMSLQELSQVEEIVSSLRKMRSESNRLGMGRFGINVDRALGIKVTDLRKLARRIEKGHELAHQLWETGIHEARLLATMVDVPPAVTEKQMESWAADFDSWDMVDQACNNLFRKTPFAHTKAVQWADRKEEFVKRAGFALMAVLAVHDRSSGDTVFKKYLAVVERESSDERNFVKKAVNWALRQIGKRDHQSWKMAMATISRITEQDSKSARWIAADATRELSRIGSQRGWG